MGSLTDFVLSGFFVQFILEAIAVKTDNEEKVQLSYQFLPDITDI